LTHPKRSSFIAERVEKTTKSKCLSVFSTFEVFFEMFKMKVVKCL